MGKDDEAYSWIARALAVDGDNMEILASHGDMNYRLANHELAKKIYEKMLKHDKDDPRPQVSLGNLYFHAFVEGSKRSDPNHEYAAYLKNCYKFYHTVLTKDSKNVFSANGLGMVFAVKEEYDCAREVFQQARESNMLNDDISTNLAHIHSLQKRYAEAEHAYQANLKSISKNCRQFETGALNTLCESLAFAQFKHNCHDDSLRSLLRGIHQEPNSNCLRTWYNIAVVRLALATSIMSKKGQKSAMNVMDATNELRLAQNLFNFLANQSQGKAMPYVGKNASKHEKKCMELSETFKEHLEVAHKDEERRQIERKKQEEEHQERLKLKEEEKQKALLAAEQAKRDKQKAAEDRAKRLEEIKEKWVAIPAASMTSKKEKKGRTVGDSDEDNTQQIPMDSDDDDDLAFLNDISDSSKAQVTSEEADLFGDDDDIFSDVPSNKNKRKAGDNESGDNGDVSPIKRGRQDEEDVELFGV